MASAIEPAMNGGGNSDGLLKSMDANRYATKKTIAQGMLDIALLTANASQLKYILQVGDKHEFYTLMLTLISISIILQIAQCMVVIFLCKSNINKEENHSCAQKGQNLSSILNVMSVLVNMFINSLGMKKSDLGPF